MNVYDFDGTIYKGDSTTDFFLMLAKKNKRVYTYIPKFLIGIIQYELGTIDRAKNKEYLYRSLALFDNIDELIKEFWDTHKKNIFDWYPKQKKDDDIIISASPDFLVRPYCESIGLKYIIASTVDKNTGKTLGPNCSKDEKVNRLKLEYPGKENEIDEFYSDHLKDTPLAKLSKLAYIVLKNGDRIPWPRH